MRASVASFITAVMLISIIAAYFTGTTVKGRQDTIRQNLCLTDKLLVNQTTQQLRSTPARLIHQLHVEKLYNKGYRRDVYFIHQLEQVSPCPLMVTIPPNVLKGGH